MPRSALVAPGPALSAAERTRHARHLLLPGVGEEGQRRLANARVLLVGAGGLGSPAALYLAAAGVGTLTIVDDDLVDLTNLQRQILHGETDVGRRKVDSARDAVSRIAGATTVHTVDRRLDESSVLPLVADHDLVIDGADNFPTRALVSRACALLAVPHVWASVHRFDAQASVWWAGEGPCYHCVFPQQPSPDQVPSCAVGGVLGATVGAIGSVLAVEAIKLIVGLGEPLIGRLLVHDGLAQTWDTLTVRADPDCRVCGSEADPTAPLSGGTAEPVPAAYRPGEGVAPEDLAGLLEGGATLIDVREPGEREIVTIPGAIPLPLAAVLAGAPVPPGVLVVHCKSGGRSARAVATLRARGVDARNLDGGILAWVARIRPEESTY